MNLNIDSVYRADCDDQDDDVDNKDDDYNVMIWRLNDDVIKLQWYNDDLMLIMKMLMMIVGKNMTLQGHYLLIR